MVLPQRDLKGFRLACVCVYFVEGVLCMLEYRIATARVKKTHQPSNTIYFFYVAGRTVQYEGLTLIKIRSR